MKFTKNQIRKLASLAFKEGDVALSIKLNFINEGNGATIENEKTLDIDVSKITSIASAIEEGVKSGDSCLLINVQLDQDTFSMYQGKIVKIPFLDVTVIDLKAIISELKEKDQKATIPEFEK